MTEKKKTLPRLNFTATPNVIFDEAMREMTEAELKVVLTIVRLTYGWHKESDAISFSQFEEITGLSRSSVMLGLRRAIARGWVKKVGAGARGMGIYSAVIEAETGSNFEPVQNSNQSEITTNTGSDFEPMTGSNFEHTKETPKKGNKKRKRRPSVIPLSTDAGNDSVEYVSREEIEAFMNGPFRALVESKRA